jgi:hypothetical protein
VYGDFSRFDGPRLDEDGVWFQQGRLQLDADHNQQAASVRQWLRTLTQDMVGAYGGPGTRAGFKVSIDLDGDLLFSSGHYYVLGSRIALEPPGQGRPWTLDRLSEGRQRPRMLPKPPFLVYVQVWDETFSAVADPGMLEAALGPNPPDTVVRARTAWRVRVDPNVSWLSATPEKGGTSGREWVNEVYERWSRTPMRPRLRARVRAAGSARDQASVISPTAGYRGVENQLYRVEIHRPTVKGKSGGETFKWSRDNGSVEFGILSVATGEKTEAGPLTVVTVTSLGRDARTTLRPGDWVEVINRSWAPFGEPGSLLPVHRVDPVTNEVTVLGDVWAPGSPERTPRAILRRWDQSPDSGDNGGISVRHGSRGETTDDSWIELEDGVQVQFPTTDAHYQRGDYWLIPARTATGSVRWPMTQDGPAAVEPMGPQRRYAPLALVTSEKDVTDLRTLFVPLAFPDTDPLPAVGAAAAAPPEGEGGPREFPPIPEDEPRSGGGSQTDTDSHG